MGQKTMRSFALVSALAFVVFAYSAQIDSQEVADLKEDVSADMPEPADINSADCSSVRSSLPSLCKMFGESYCGKMRARLETSCKDVPEEETESFLETEEDSSMPDQDSSDYSDLGEMQGRRGGGALMTSGSFTMMSSNRAGNSERTLGDADDEKEKVEDWDIRKGGKCGQEEAWMAMDAEDESLGKCVEFEADSKCSPQCFHQGKSVDETVTGAVCSKICRVPGASGAQCNVIKSVTPMKEESKGLGEGKTMYLTRSKVMQAGLDLNDLSNADPMACAGVATNRRA